MPDRGFLVTWGLFRALEAALDGDGLRDRTVDDLYEAVLEEIGCGGLHEGWHLVATQLRQSLIRQPRNSAVTAAASNGSSVSSWDGRRTFPTPEGSRT